MKSPLRVRLSKDSNSWPLATPGIGRNSTLSIQLKTVVLAAIPIASVSTATSVKPGLLSDIRRPNRKSCTKVRMCPSSRDQADLVQSPCHLLPLHTRSHIVPASRCQGVPLFERVCNGNKWHG